MKPSSLDHLLAEESGRSASDLPDGFASQVLRRARRVRRAAVAHWKVLAAGSLVAIALSVLTGFVTARSAGERADRPPAADLFQSEPARFAPPSTASTDS